MMALRGTEELKLYTLPVVQVLASSPVAERKVEVNVYSSWICMCVHGVCY